MISKIMKEICTIASAIKSGVEKMLNQR